MTNPVLEDAELEAGIAEQVANAKAILGEKHVPAVRWFALSGFPGKGVTLNRPPSTALPVVWACESAMDICCSQAAAIKGSSPLGVATRPADSLTACTRVWPPGAAC